MKVNILILLLLVPCFSFGQYKERKAKKDRIELVVSCDTLDHRNDKYWDIQFEKAKIRKREEGKVWIVFLVIIVILIKI